MESDSSPQQQHQDTQQSQTLVHLLIDVINLQSHLLNHGGGGLPRPPTNKTALAPMASSAPLDAQLRAAQAHYESVQRLQRLHLHQATIPNPIHIVKPPRSDMSKAQAALNHCLSTV